MALFVNLQICWRMDRNILIQWATAKVIWDARNERGLSQVQLADFAGLSEPFISEVERGNTGMGIDALVQVGEVLQVDAGELMRRILEELKRGPKRPEKAIGRPPKTEKKEKTPKIGKAGEAVKKKAGKAGAAAKKKSGAATKKKAGKAKRESAQEE